jgi:hypothetical protein
MTEALKLTGDYKLYLNFLFSGVVKWVQITEMEQEMGFFWEKGKKKGKVVPVLNLIKHYAIKAYGGVDV